MSVTHRMVVILVLLSVGIAPVAAQDMPKDEYFHYVPLEVPRLVRQSPASADLYLYGDPGKPGYRDEAPRDGIDDQRHHVLEQMAVRFAPYMVLNTTNVPLNFRAFRQGRSVYNLHVDVWNTVVDGGTLVKEETVNLLNTARTPCPQLGWATERSSDDCRLLELLDYYDPDDPTSAIERTEAVRTDEDLLQILYVDFPGFDAGSWKAEFVDRATGKLPTKYRDALFTFVHPFIQEVGDPDDPAGYELIFQYWFFYPYNDWGNNHKGDWEHINVTI